MTKMQQIGISVIVSLGLLLFWGNIATAEAEEVKAKPRIVARYSDSGIVSNEGQEKYKVYQYQVDGVTVFTDKAPSNNDYQILLYECFACRPDSKIDWNGIRLFTRNYESVISRAAHQHKLDPALIRAVIHAESAFNSRALSRTGAMGLMQLMPETAKEMGVSNAFIPEENILGGSKYLAQMLKQFNGNIALACAAYNAGPTTVSQYNGIPPYPETKAYVERVQILLKRYRSAKA